MKSSVDEIVKFENATEHAETQHATPPTIDLAPTDLRVGELTFEEDTSGGLGRHLGVFSATFLM